MRKTWKIEAMLTESKVMADSDGFNMITFGQSKSFFINKIKVNYSNKGWGNSIILSTKDEKSFVVRDIYPTIVRHGHEVILKGLMPVKITIRDEDENYHSIEMISICFHLDESLVAKGQGSIEFLDNTGKEVFQSYLTSLDFDVVKEKTQTLYQEKIKDLQKEVKNLKISENRLKKEVRVREESLRRFEAACQSTVGLSSIYNSDWTLSDNSSLYARWSFE